MAADVSDLWTRHSALVLVPVQNVHVFAFHVHIHNQLQQCKTKLRETLLWKLNDKVPTNDFLIGKRDHSGIQ